MCRTVAVIGIDHYSHELHPCNAITRPKLNQPPPTRSSMACMEEGDCHRQDIVLSILYDTDCLLKPVCCVVSPLHSTCACQARSFTAHGTGQWHPCFCNSSWGSARQHLLFARHTHVIFKRPTDLLCNKLTTSADSSVYVTEYLPCILLIVLQLTVSTDP